MAPRARIAATTCAMQPLCTEALSITTTEFFSPAMKLPRTPGAQSFSRTHRRKRSLFTPMTVGGSKTLLPVDVNMLWQYGVGLLQAQGQISAAQAAGLAALSDAGVGVKLNVFDPIAGTVTPIASVVVPDAIGLQPSITATTVQLYVSNLFDSDYRSFVGVPNI